MGFFINALPALLPLIAAFIVCIISFVREFSTSVFTVILAAAVTVFYIIGVIAKRILRKHYDAALETYREKKKAEIEAEVAAAAAAKSEEAKAKDREAKDKNGEAGQDKDKGRQNKA